MKLDCQILEAIQRDFNALWTCKVLGDTLEITTPYLLPNSTLVSVFLTERVGRFIVCDGGIVREILDEYCSLPPDEVESEIVNMRAKFGMKEGEADGGPIYFKEHSDAKLIPSLAFDVANFIVMATSNLVASSGEPTTPVESRFEKRADIFLHTIALDGFEFVPREMPEIPNVRFGSVLNKGSQLWIFSYITGSNPTYFRRSVCESVVNFSIAWHSRIASRIKYTIPVVNTDAAGFEPDKLGSQLDELKTNARHPFVRWDSREQIRDILAANGS